MWLSAQRSKNDRSDCFGVVRCALTARCSMIGLVPKWDDLSRVAGVIRAFLAQRWHCDIILQPYVRAFIRGRLIVDGCGVTDTRRRLYDASNNNRLEEFP